MMKKLISITLSMVLIFSFAALAVDARSATETARSLAPAESVYLYTEKDGKVYEVHFLNESTNEEFEISVPIDETGKIKIETENDFVLGSTQNTLTEENIRAAVLAEYPDAQIDSYFTVREDGLYEVHVYFTAYDHFGRVKLNAENGRIIERKIILAAPLTGWQTELDDDYYEDAQIYWNGNWANDRNNAPSAATSPKNNEQPSNNEKNKNNDSGSINTSFISISQAKTAVTSSHPGAKITEIELDFEGGRYVYEGEAYLNGREYDFKVDAITGSLLRWKLDD